MEQLSLNPSKISTKEDKIKYYAAFSYLPYRPLLKAKLFEYFDYDIIKAFNVSKDNLALMSESMDITVPKEFLNKRDKINVDECYKKAFLDKDVKIITYEDEKYPPLLRQIPDFPLALYYKGDIENISYKHLLAVVGSRAASTEGKCALDNIIRGFYTSPITIVSGLAYGIDATAHTSALKNDLQTIAVVGSGLDIIYPSKNTQLFYEIIEKGGVVFSEYPLKTRPIPANFPQRNRIVVGMSHGTFVVEAQLRSGAMISANLAIDYNRELMCMPGNVLNPNTEGIFKLIKNGSGIVCDTFDVLDQMGWKYKINEKFDPWHDLSFDQTKVFEVMSKEAKTFDEILSLTNMEVSCLMVVLTELELKGLIIQSNNKYYKCV